MNLAFQWRSVLKHMTYIPDIDMNRPCLGLESAIPFKFLHTRDWNWNLLGIGIGLPTRTQFSFALEEMFRLHGLNSKTMQALLELELAWDWMRPLY